MKSIICIGLLFISQLSFALRTADQIDESSLDVTPESVQGFMRFELRKSPFHYHLAKILKRATSNFHEQLQNIEIGDLDIYGREGCEEMALLPGTDDDEEIIKVIDEKTGKEKELNRCFYAPNSLLHGFSNYEVNGLGLLDLAKSSSIVASLVNMKIEELQIGNIRAHCNYEGESAVCPVDIEIDRFVFSTGIKVRSSSTGKRLLGTVSPQKVIFDKVDAWKPKLSFKVMIKKGVIKENPITIDPQSVYFVIPRDAVSYEINNDENDIEEVIKQELENNKDDDEERLKQILETDKKRWKLLEYILREHVFTPDRAIYLVDKIDESLGEVLSELFLENIEKVKAIEIDIPLTTVEDIANEDSYVKVFNTITYKYNEVKKALENVEDDDNFLHGLLNVSKDLNKVRTAVKNIGLTRSKRIYEAAAFSFNELALFKAFLVEQKDVIHAKKAKNMRGRQSAKRIYKELDKKLTKTLDSFAIALADIHNNLSDAERKMHITPSYLNTSPENYIQLGLGFNHAQPSVEDFNYKTPKSCLGNEDFVASINIDWLNDYLKRLHRKGYFQMCISDEGKACIESTSDTEVEIDFKRAPKFVYDEEKKKYFLEIRKIKTKTKLSGFNFTKIPVLRALTNDQMKVRIDFNQYIIGDEPLLSKEHIELDFNSQGSKLESLALALVNPIGALIFTLANTTLRDALLEEVLADETTIVADGVDTGLKFLDQIKITEAYAENGQFYIYGRYLLDENSQSKEMPVRCRLKNLENGS